MAFQQAVAKMGKEDEERLLRQFRLTLPSLPTDADKPAPSASAYSKPKSMSSAWNQLGLLYTPTWPLHILFTYSVVEK